MSLLAALAAGLALSVAQADLSDLKPADRADLQCLAVTLTAISGSQDEEQKAGLAAGAMLYYGRLQGRTPGTDWMRRLADYAQSEPIVELQANAERCGQDLSTVGASFNSLESLMQGS